MVSAVTWCIIWYCELEFCEAVPSRKSSVKFKLIFLSFKIKIKKSLHTEEAKVGLFPHSII
jgi:hypothetical protein